MTFVPHKPETMVKVEVNLKELYLLRELRKYPFGSFVVHKAEGMLVRVEIRESKLIKGEVNST